ncbi:MAG: uroporphyrinogen decarboxylase family protein [Eisenbergiella sp.]
MKRDMKQWLEEWKASPVKKAFPVLSFPAVQLMGISVKELISDAAAQARGMKLVAEHTDSAASVSLMDLSVEAECFGAEIRVSEDEVPTVVGSVVSTEEEAEALEIPPIGSGRTGIYIDAIRQVVKEITDRPVFAGVIGPYSLAGRLMDVTEIMILCYEEPDMVHAVLKKVTRFLTDYCLAYKEAGANGVIMAEPLAGILSPALEEEFSEPYVRELVEAVQDDSFAVIYHNCGGGVSMMASSIASTGAAAFHFGNAVDMEEMLEKMPKDRLVMGNIDPAGQFRNGTPESIREETLALMERCCKYDNFVISSGCDIPPMSKWENIDAFFDAAAEFYGAGREA